MGIGFKSETSINDSFTEFRPPQWAEQIAFSLFKGQRPLKREKTGTPKGCRSKRLF